jgi:signal peptidase I
MNNIFSEQKSFTPEPVSKNPSVFWETVRLILITVAIVVPIRIFIAQPFVVHGESMDPTFESGQYLIVDELSYNLSSPQRGDVAILRYPQNPKIFFIKRVIGLPGETVKIDGNTITIINDEHPEGFVLDEPYIQFPATNVMEKKVPEENYFVMGDNRAKSSDSRVWGTVPEKYMTGRALVRLLPLGTASLLPGNISFEE